MLKRIYVLKLILSIVFLFFCVVLFAQKNNIKYVKSTIYFSDGDLSYIQIEDGRDEGLPKFRKEMNYNGRKKPYDLMLYTSDTLDSIYFSLNLFGSTMPNNRARNIIHLFFDWKTNTRETLEIVIIEDSVHTAHLEVETDEVDTIYRYQLSENVLEHYERLVQQHLDSVDLREISLKVHPSKSYNNLIEKSYWKNYIGPEDSIFRYNITESYFNDKVIKDSVLKYKWPAQPYKNHIEPRLNEVPKIKKRRKNYKTLKPYYLNPKYTKGIEKGYKYEKRFDKQQAPNYQIYYEIFYE